jgi:hypothetical protein
VPCSKPTFAMHGIWTQYRQPQKRRRSTAMKQSEWLSDKEFSVDGVRFLCALDDYSLKTNDDRLVILKDRESLESYAAVFSGIHPRTMLEFGIFHANRYRSSVPSVSSVQTRGSPGRLRWRRATRARAIRTGHPGNEKDRHALGRDEGRDRQVPQRRSRERLHHRGGAPPAPRARRTHCPRRCPAFGSASRR